MTLNESKKQQQQQPQPVSPLQGKDFESNLLTELEISAYDLAALQRHLTDKNLVPASVDEDTINKAVYEFRRSYDYGCPRGLFPANKRLEKLFEAWSDACVAAWMRDHGERDVRARYELEHQRETTKYNAVRALIAHLAARRQTEADN